MSDHWGNQLGLSIFGESHGPAIGMVVDGLPAGTAIDEEMLMREMNRRAPGQSATSTARKEADRVEIISGVFEGKATGTAICGIIRNSDTRSRDYEDVKRFLRPGHADYSGKVRYSGFNDIRGGGHFSGRLTAPFLFAGALCKQYLLTQGISIYGRVLQIGHVRDEAVSYHTAPDAFLWEKASARVIPALSAERADEMEKVILEAKEDADSVGGIVEIMTSFLPPGLGNPFFDSVESTLAHLAFSVPAVKGVEFGAGFALAGMRGSEGNDAPFLEDKQILTKTNYNGGVTGGITNGMPLIFRAVLKPTPSISRAQETVDMSLGENATFVVKGRHDPCVVPRAVPVLEAAAAIALTEVLLIAIGNQGGRNVFEFRGESGKN